jgi:hypothetical protein
LRESYTILRRLLNWKAVISIEKGEETVANKILWRFRGVFVAFLGQELLKGTSVFGREIAK